MQIKGPTKVPLWPLDCQTLRSSTLGRAGEEVEPQELSHSRCEHCSGQPSWKWSDIDS